MAVHLVAQPVVLMRKERHMLEPEPFHFSLSFYIKETIEEAQLGLLEGMYSCNNERGEGERWSDCW